MMNIKRFLRIFVCLLIMTCMMPLCVHAENIPSIYISTAEQNGLGLEKADGYTNALIQVTNGETIIVNGTGMIKVRGNSTAEAPKKPYKIKLDTKQNLFGMGMAKKWVLLANCFDPTMLRNALAFDLAKELGLAYTSQYTFAEVWMDGTYLGCYQLTEPVEAKNTRVNIDADEGDFLIEYEKSRSSPDDIYLVAEGWRYRISEPEIPTKQQLSHIEAVMSEAQRAVRSGTYDAIPEILDIESFAKFYLLNEIFKTNDFGYSSVYFYYQDEKLYAGPVWDFDLSAGNTNAAFSIGYTNAVNPEELYATTCHFFTYLLQYPEFEQEVARIYAEHYDYIESLYVPGGRIDQLREQYAGAFGRNYQIWDISESYTILMKNPKPTYEENIAYLKDWLRKRNHWLSEYYNIFDDFPRGDINHDGAVSVLDLVLLKKYLLKQETFTQMQFKAGDLNWRYGWPDVNIYDLILLKKILLNLSE